MRIPIQIRPISNVIGSLLLVVGVLMLVCLPASFYFKSGDHFALLISSGITILGGILLSLIRRKDSSIITKREGYLIVALGWVSMIAFGMLPYLISGVIENVPNAIFETTSGLTTTGASIITNIEIIPEGILLWRSMSQWIGGMGIVVLTVAIFPLLGIGGIELFVAEAPGPTSDKIHPRIKETAKRLWFIYVGLTALLFILLVIGGMTGYDALNHALTTLATGGFSTKNASMAHFTSPFIQYTVALFMLLAGTNYTVLYFGLKGKISRVWKSEEFRTYLIIVFLATLFVFVPAYVRQGGLEQSFRDSLFQTVSLITTTGFVSADYTAWGNSVTMFCFALLFVGACAGSTSGGIKIVRHMVFVKNSVLEFKRLLHPRAMIRTKINGEVVQPHILTHILVFLLIYLASFIIGTIVVTSCGLDFLTAMGSVATSLGNVGPGIGDVGPMDNFAQLSSFVKVFLSFLMLLGRLELFTILVLCTTYFWKDN